MYRLWIEWDFGQDNIVFTSEAAARDWVNNHDLIIEMFKRDIAADDEGEDDRSPFDYYDWDGLLSLEKLEVI